MSTEQKIIPDEIEGKLREIYEHSLKIDELYQEVEDYFEKQGFNINSLYSDFQVSLIDFANGKYPIGEFSDLLRDLRAMQAAGTERKKE